MLALAFVSLQQAEVERLFVLFFRCFTIVFILFYANQALAAPDDFAEAKRLAQKIFSDEATDFYCDCPITWQGGKGRVELNRCDYKVRKNGPRAQRVEWEHVVPAQQFGSGRACWQQGGRDHCGDSDKTFRRIEADLFNLRPALGEVNGDRAHFRFAELPGTPAQHGACPVRIDFQRQLAEPRSEIRGDIARIYFYMADRYQLKLSVREEQLFLRWHQQDPVDEREMMLMKRTSQQMGHQNEFVTGAKIWYPGYLPKQLSAASPEAADVPPLSADMTEKTLPVRGNKNSKKYHFSHCSGFASVKVANQQEFSSAAAAEAAGFKLAGNCKVQQP